MFGDEQMSDLITIYEEILCGKRRQFPLETWNQPDSQDVLIKLVKYVVLDKLSWNREHFCKNFCLKTIKSFKLNTGFDKVYNRNIYPLILDSFPEWDIKAWEMQSSRAPVGFWTLENAVSATKWLIEEKLRWDLDKVSKDISNAAFLNNNLGGMLRVLKINISLLVEQTYPEYDWTYLKERQGYKITSSQASKIRNLYNKGIYNQRQLAQKFNVNPSQVFLIVHNKSFKNIH